MNECAVSTYSVFMESKWNHGLICRLDMSLSLG